MDREPTRYNGKPDTVLALVLDCVDLDRTAAFWRSALGYVSDADAGEAEDGGGGETARYHRLLPADGRGVELLLQRVDEPKLGKNRMHVDLRHRDLGAETARLLAAGARHTTGEMLREDGWCWYVLEDPEGNEFCVLQPPEEMFEA
ncbi:VOC family protein [Actinospica robiniae]|uniref:VOC family protein n=1 Tax=Actinospica robiniae TaxID=304901 RepID=UPI000688E53B|nr:VOC family protein [Actinospica robiniae]